MGTVQVPRWLFVTALLMMTLSYAQPGNAAEKELNPANKRCLMCHQREQLSAKMANGDSRSLYVNPDEFTDSVHGGRECVECHKDIIKVPHRKGIDRKVSCINCHETLWEEAQSNGHSDDEKRLGEVVLQIDSYMHSVHARPNREDQSRTNATCYDCHDAHKIQPIDTAVGDKARLDIPAICGRCHTDIKDAYLASVHGEEVTSGNASAAVCSDCHTTHNIESPVDTTTRIAITRNCGNCHQEELETYLSTYHGQVSTLGYTNTAKCYECHGFHEIKRVSDPASLMNVENRVETCRRCHEDASAGFASFQPHGNTKDKERFPIMWFASKFMILLLASVFLFFWSHSALWFYREWKDRKEGKVGIHVKVSALPEGGKKYIRRFPLIWRTAHLVGALSIMLLVLTGTTVLYADSAWAPVVIKLLKGPENAALLHRIGAIGFMIVFFSHLIYFGIRIGKQWRTFEWFGPDSLIPRWQDFKDAYAMFLWFFGRGERPMFDRWTYYEKFDYWAPFWGMFIIGISGLMLWFPGTTASFLPGWVFNVGTIVHGEEAFLATVFLFSVHFFNCHFRPDKWPQDIVMFTGVLPLDEFRKEHPLEYQRMVDEGRLEEYLVDAPSAPMTRYSKILGIVLIITGLLLLTMVMSGFLGHMF